MSLGPGMEITGPLIIKKSDGTLVTVIDANGNIDAPVTTTDLTTSGNTTLGDASTDTLTVNAQFVGDIDFVKEANHDISIITTTTAATAGGTLSLTGAGGATSGAGGPITITAGVGGATGAGGAASLVGGAGGATSGAGGLVSVTGGAATAGNSAGGQVNITGGVGSGTSAGGAVTILSGNGANAAAAATGGASGAVAIQSGTAGTADTGTGGAGGAVSAIAAAGGASSGAGGTGGAGGTARLTAGDGGADGEGASGTGGAGGNVILTPGAGGAGNTAGIAGLIRNVGLISRQQGAPAAKTTDTTLTVAELRGGMITANQGAAGTATYTLPTGTLIDAEFPMSVDDSFDFIVINISTVAAETATLATAAGLTLVGNLTVAANNATTDQSSGIFRFRKTAANTFSIYRIA